MCTVQTWIAVAGDYDSTAGGYNVKGIFYSFDDAAACALKCMKEETLEIANVVTFVDGVQHVIEWGAVEHWDGAHWVQSSKGPTWVIAEPQRCIAYIPGSIGG